MDNRDSAICEPSFETESATQRASAMSAQLAFRSIPGPNPAEATSAFPPPPSNPIAIIALEGHPAIRSSERLRLHQALVEFDWVGVVREFNESVQLTNVSEMEPVLTITNGTILAGFGRWRAAVCDGRHEINCIEYPLSDDEALQFIIRHHRPQLGWNAFVRIRLALKPEPYFQQRALENMRVGGKYKGSANLPEARHIDVRQEIARAAGVGARNVSNVRSARDFDFPILRGFPLGVSAHSSRLHRGWQEPMPVRRRVGRFSST